MDELLARTVDTIGNLKGSPAGYGFSIPHVLVRDAGYTTDTFIQAVFDQIDTAVEIKTDRETGDLIVTLDPDFLDPRIIQ
jgi:hypothetical protein